MYLIHMVDLLMNQLIEELGEFDIIKDNIRFVAFGYGAYILNCYLAY